MRIRRHCSVVGLLLACCLAVVLIAGGCGSSQKSDDAGGADEARPPASSDSGASETSATTDNSQPGMPCSGDSDCGNPFLACVSQMATLCRDPNSASADAGSETLPGNIPNNLPLCPTVAQVTVNLCSVRYQLPCRVDSDCGPDEFTCNGGQCSQPPLTTCSGDAVCPQGWSCYAPCGGCGYSKYCYPPFSMFSCPICLGSLVDGG
jgi:hypothetical protein